MAAKENSAKFGYPISANRELVALGMSADYEASKPLTQARLFMDLATTGASNFAVSFCTGTGCVPAFGSITRSRYVKPNIEPQARSLG